MINQYPQYPIGTEYSQPENNRKWIFILIGLVLLVIIASYFLFFRAEESPKPPKIAVCGNDICETGENCYDCPRDCKCEANEYCIEETKQCTPPICGNGKCEPFENIENCCDDCGCILPEETCNEITHKCELPEAEISDDRVRELVIEYYNNKSKVVNNIEDITLTTHQSKPAKSCRVNLEGEGEYRYWVVVTEQEEVIELPTLQ